MLTVAGFIYNKLSDTLKWSTAVKLKDMLFIDGILTLFIVANIILM